RITYEFDDPGYQLTVVEAIKALGTFETIVGEDPRYRTSHAGAVLCLTARQPAARAARHVRRPARVVPREPRGGSRRRGRASWSCSIVSPRAGTRADDAQLALLGEAGRHDQIDVVVVDHFGRVIDVI